MAHDQAYYEAEKIIEQVRRAIVSASHHTDKRIPLNRILSSPEPIPFNKVRRTLSRTKGGHYGA